MLPDPRWLNLIHSGGQGIEVVGYIQKPLTRVVVSDLFRLLSKVSGLCSVSRSAVGNPVSIARVAWTQSRSATTTICLILIKTGRRSPSQHRQKQAKGVVKEQS